MSESIWRKIDEVFPQVADLPAAERDARLRELCDGDETLRREILALLEADKKAADFCEAPAVMPNSLSGVFAPVLREAPPGERVGAYRIVRKIGAGGMGAVYLAERADGAFQKKVAVKFVRRAAATDFNLRRFQHERQILAALEHENIARLLDGGTTGDGAPYLVMEYVEGKMLFDFCRAHDLDLPARLKLFRQICAAVAAAHDKQIVHRDLKPGNILVAGDGTVKLLDFGIAKILDNELLGEPVVQTETLWRQMTPEYASPEQIKGGEITPISDIYSLGVILYELATGERPYKFASRAPHEIARVVCEEAVRLPRRRAFQLSNAEDLSAIILKALQKKPSERFSSVAALAADIERFTTNLPVLSGDTRLELFEKSENSGSAVSLAVAPFQILLNENADSNDAQDEFLGVGLAESLSTKLSGLREITVLSTNSGLRAAESGRHTPQTGRQIAADYLLEGYILRADNRIRVSVQLLKSADFSILWAEHFDEVEDILRVRDSISERVAALLVPRLTVEQQKTSPRRAMKDGKAIRKSGVDGRRERDDSLFGAPSAESEPETAPATGGIAAPATGEIPAGKLKSRAVIAAVLALLGGSMLLVLFSNFAFPGSRLGEKMPVAEMPSNETAPKIRKPRTNDAAAENFYQSGKEQMEIRSKDSLARAIEFFNEAVRRDPDFAHAYAGLANASILSVQYSDVPRETYRKAETFALRALALDPDLAEARTSLGMAVFRNAGNFELAEKHFRRAIELDPSYPTAHHWYSVILDETGRFDEALREIKRAAELDPGSAIITFTVGELYLKQKRYEEALAYFDKAIANEKGFVQSYIFKSFAQQVLGDYNAALETYRTGIIYAGGGENDPLWLIMQAQAAAANGRQDAARANLRRFLNTPEYRKNPDFLSLDVALVYNLLGERERAFGVLSKLKFKRAGEIKAVSEDPRFANLRADARFTEIIEKWNTSVPQTD